jgi:hypothetical protein
MTPDSLPDEEMGEPERPIASPAKSHRVSAAPPEISIFLVIGRPEKRGDCIRFRAGEGTCLKRVQRAYPQALHFIRARCEKRKLTAVGRQRMSQRLT